jgi:hypothetical protein
MRRQRPLFQVTVRRQYVAGLARRAQHLRAVTVRRRRCTNAQDTTA